MATIPSAYGPLGFFVPPSELGPPNPLLADAIDLETRDFASLTVGEDPTDAAVKVALGTVRASGIAVVDVGMPRPPTKMDSAHLAVVQSNVRTALRELTARKDIALISVTAEADEANQTTTVLVKYRNLRAFDSAVRTLPLPYPQQIPG